MTLPYRRGDVATRFITAADLMLQLAAANAQGRLRESFNPVLGPRLLVADEIGYLPFGFRLPAHRQTSFPLGGVAS